MSESNEKAVQKEKNEWKGEIKREENNDSSYLEVSCKQNPRFVFIFYRYKALDTKKEFLSIKVYQRKKNGTVDKTDSYAEMDNISVPDLQIRLQRDMSQYGVILQPRDFIKIYQTVMAYYLDLDAISVKTDGITITDAIIADVYQMLIEYIQEQKVNSVNHKSYKSYDILVPDFQKLIEGSVFCRYNYNDLRLKLSEYKKLYQ